MLIELRVSDFAIIKKLNIQFKDGLNIISGETGAGKSILLKSLALLMGGKAQTDTVRREASQAVVEGCFDISKRNDVKDQMELSGIPHNDELMIVRRTISNQGRSRIYINGSMSTLAQLQSVVSPLIEVTGRPVPLIELTAQHENKALTERSYHIDILDIYSGDFKKRNDFSSQWNHLKALVLEKENLERESREKSQRLDFLKYQLNEIDELELKEDPEFNLEDSYKRVKNANRIAELSQSIDQRLYGGESSAFSFIEEALSQIRELSHLDSTLSKEEQNLESAKSLLEDTVYNIQVYLRNLDNSESNLNELEHQLSQLRKIQKKYGSSIDDILKARDQMAIERDRLESSDMRLAELEKEINKNTIALQSLAETLSKKRKSAAKLLQEGVNVELKELNMKGVLFTIELTKLQEFCSTGLDSVEFKIQNSPKDIPRPISKVASGGELSRILLALKQIVGHSELPRTYLFDEVDTGVSGQTAERVGKKLLSISKEQQVICVTHLPQVASFGDYHFLIEKGSAKDEIQMKVERLQGEDRVKEIARLISGQKITKTSIAHAKELISMSR